MKPNRLSFAPREIFLSILEYAVIPTFDLIVWFEGRGLIMLRRKISPYRNVWALPGLRVMKPERIEDTLTRIGVDELGLQLDPSMRFFVGQFMGRFRTEGSRQDLSTCYALLADRCDVSINSDHFSECRFIASASDIPSRTGAMYRYYLEEFFSSQFFQTIKYK